MRRPGEIHHEVANLSSLHNRKLAEVLSGSLVEAFEETGIFNKGPRSRLSAHYGGGGSDLRHNPGSQTGRSRLSAELAVLTRTWY